MISKLPGPEPINKQPSKQLDDQLQTIQQPIKEPIMIQNKTLSEFRSELKLVQSKIKDLQTKRYAAKSNEWRNMNQDINEILKGLTLKRLRKVFERKFEQQIRLLKNLYANNYQKSMFQFCFFCCPNFITKKLKYYKFIEDVFQRSVSELHKLQRNIYFYVNLLYIKLFSMMVAVEDRLKEQFNKKMIEAVAFQAKQKKIVEQREREVGQLQDINDVFVMEEEDFKSLEDENKIASSYIIQSDNLRQVHGKTQPREPLDNKLMKQNYYDGFKLVQTEIHNIISTDWQQIINCEEWNSQSYYGFVQIDSNPPIQTALQFKDCKLKTNHLFGQISSSSFDFRTYLVNKSRTFQRQKYVLHSLYEDSLPFQLRFWLCQSQSTEENYMKIEKFILLAMRIGIKQKIHRTCSIKYKECTKNWMASNYLHVNHKKSQKYTQVDKLESEKSKESRIVPQNQQIMSPEKFWWVNLGQALVRAIIQVAKERHMQKKDRQMAKRQSFNRNQKESKQWQNNPESIDRLLKGAKIGTPNYHSANQL